MNPLILTMAMAAAAPAAPAPAKAPTPIYLNLTAGHELTPKFGIGLYAMPDPDVMLSVDLGWTHDYTLNDATALPLDYSAASFSRRPVVMSPEVEIPAHIDIRVGITFRVR